jgi:hypothetical protein
LLIITFYGRRAQKQHATAVPCQRSLLARENESEIMPAAHARPDKRLHQRRAAVAGNRRGYASAALGLSG